MATSTTIVDKPLPQAMQQHTYSIMRQVEGAHWWFVGRRRIIESFLRDICAKLDAPHPQILDVGCGNGAQLARLREAGHRAIGVEVDPEAARACQRSGHAVVIASAENLPFVAVAALASSARW